MTATEVDFSATCKRGDSVYLYTVEIELEPRGAVIRVGRPIPVHVCEGGVIALESIPCGELPAGTALGKIE